jgi:hypothetical protein
MAIMQEWLLVSSVALLIFAAQLSLAEEQVLLGQQQPPAAEDGTSPPPPPKQDSTPAPVSKHAKAEDSLHQALKLRCANVSKQLLPA